MENTEVEDWKLDRDARQEAKRIAFWERNRKIVEEGKRTDKRQVKPFYLYPDSKDAFRNINAEVMLKQIEERRWEFVIEMGGVLANYQRVLNNLSEEQKETLQLIRYVMEAGIDALEKKHAV